jgi:hypothetical protein
MKPRSKMSRPLGPSAPAWPLGNPNLLPHRLNYARRSEAMAAGMDARKIDVVDLTADRDLSADERASQIMLQGYVHLAGQIGLTGRS